MIGPPQAIDASRPVIHFAAPFQLHAWHRPGLWRSAPDRRVSRDSQKRESQGLEARVRRVR